MPDNTAVRGARLHNLKNLSNVPIPEAFVAALLSGGAAHAVAARPISRDLGALRAGGLALLLLGLGLIAWAMAAARNIRIDRPTALVTLGPYALSRNPMYVGWALCSLAVSLLVNSRWLLVTTSAAGLYHHLHEIPKEEEFLLAHFGEEYESYRRRTRRYL